MPLRCLKRVFLQISRKKMLIKRLLLLIFFFFKINFRLGVIRHLQKVSGCPNLLKEGPIAIKSSIRLPRAPSSKRVITTLIRGGAGAGEWQERLCVVELPPGASTIAAKRGDGPSNVRNEIIGHFGLFHQRSGGDDHSFALAAITMTIPFVGGGAANLDGFLSQRETGQKHPSRQRRVSQGVSLEKTNTQIVNKSSNLHIQFKCLCTTKY